MQRPRPGDPVPEQQERPEQRAQEHEKAGHEHQAERQAGAVEPGKLARLVLVQVCELGKALVDHQQAADQGRDHPDPHGAAEELDLRGALEEVVGADADDEEPAGHQRGGEHVR